MISSSSADEAVVTEDFLRDFGYSKPQDALGKTVELLAPPGRKDADQDDNFFGIPFNNDDQPVEDSSSPIVARSLRIAGILKDSGGAREEGSIHPVAGSGGPQPRPQNRQPAHRPGS